MENIVNDASKVECFGPAATTDKAAAIKAKLRTNYENYCAQGSCLNKSMMKYALQVRQDRECSNCQKHKWQACHED